MRGPAVLGILALVLSGCGGESLNLEGCCEGPFGPVPPNPPVAIGQVVPSQGQPGTVVEITGTGYGFNPPTVSVGGVSAQIQSYTVESIVFVVPDLEPGPAVLSVQVLSSEAFEGGIDTVTFTVL